MTERKAIDQRRHSGTFIDVERMNSARVLVGGVGAVGNEVVKNLVMLGVGHIFLADLDTSEIHNLSRSVFFTFGDSEQAIHDAVPKAKFVADLVPTLNPGVEVRWYAGDINDLGAGFYRSFDLAISCFDGHLPRYIMNERCAQAGIPFIDGGLGDNYRDCAKGHIQVISVADGTSCYSCKLRRVERAACEGQLRSERFGCGRKTAHMQQIGGVPTSIMMASIIGGIQALEAAKLLSAAGDAFKGRTGTMYRIDLKNLQAVRSFSDHLAVDGECSMHDFPDLPQLEFAIDSDKDTLGDLWKQCAEEFGDDVLLKLPTRFYPAVTCSSCGERHPWISSLQPLLADGWKKSDDQELPERLRLPCGCPDGIAQLEPGCQPETYFGQAEADEPKATLRQLGLPWKHAFPVVDANGMALAFAVAGLDLQHLEFGSA